MVKSVRNDSNTQTPFQPGDILADKYRIESVLGVGGMGIVVSAIHLQLGQRFAIKLIIEQFARHPEAVGRFLREARAAVQIQSEHVARVSDVGTLPNDTPYMVMEYLEGADLGEVIESRGFLSQQEAVDYVLQATEAIAEAHSLGIVHRDLKPANLFLSRRKDGSPLVKVLDFGISKASNRDSSAAEMTATTSVMGSPQYMSPEQMRSTKNVDARTDIWALGLIVYELLSGKKPFDAETIPGLCAVIATEPPLPLATFRSDLPPGLSEAIERCLEKDPANRYQNVGELAKALLPYASRAGRTSVERIVGMMRASGLAETELNLPPSSHLAVSSEGASPTQATFANTFGPKPPRSLPIAVIVAGAAIVLGGAVGAFMFLSSSPQLPVPIVSNSPPSQLHGDSAASSPELALAPSVDDDSTPDPEPPIASSTASSVGASPSPSVSVKVSGPKPRPTSTNTRSQRTNTSPTPPEPTKTSTITDFGGRRH